MLFGREALGAQEGLKNLESETQVKRKKSHSRHFNAPPRPPLPEPASGRRDRGKDSIRPRPTGALAGPPARGHGPIAAARTPITRLPGGSRRKGRSSPPS